MSVAQEPLTIMLLHHASKAKYICVTTLVPFNPPHSVLILGTQKSEIDIVAGGIPMIFDENVFKIQHNIREVFT